MTYIVELWKPAPWWRFWNREHEQIARATSYESYEDAYNKAHFIKVQKGASGCYEKRYELRNAV